MASNSQTQNYGGLGAVTVRVDAWLESETNTTAVLCVQTRIWGSSDGPWGFGIIGQSGYQGNGSNWAEAGRGWLNYGNTIVNGTKRWTVAKTKSGWTANCWAKAWGETVSGYGAYPLSFDTRCSVWVPAGVFGSAPIAPSNPKATRKSDSQITISWTNNPPTSGGITGTYIDERINDGKWSGNINTTTSGSQTSFARTGRSINNKYEYRLAAYNSYGMSAYAYPEVVYTSPAAPSSATAIKTGNFIGLSATITNIKYPSSYEWQRASNSSFSSGLVTLDSTEASASDTTTLAVPYYRVRAKGPSGLYSSWTTASLIVNPQMYVNIPEQ